MKKAILSKLKNLVRGDDGAALVITLGVFFFMYIFCAGVYAIGFAVKEKIHLQNACDAAAYSAAVVQADAISRIATINRAMSWTYVQMTRRQMDYIVYKWLRHTIDHYIEDRNAADAQGFPGVHFHRDFSIGDENGLIAPVGDRNQVRLNANAGSTRVTGGDSLDSWVNSFLRDNLKGASFYADNLASVGQIKRLRDQLDADMKNIRTMNQKLVSLTDGTGAGDGLKNRIEDSVVGILRANIPAYMKNQCKFFIKDSPRPRRDYMRFMRADDENQFVSWMNTESLDGTRVGRYVNADGVFGKGSTTWFTHVSRNQDGIQRGYNQTGTALCSRWSWCSWNWHCEQSAFGGWNCYPVKRNSSCWHNCKHGQLDGGNPNVGSCDSCGTSTLNHRVVLKAEHLRDKYFNRDVGTQVRAMPLMLRKEYFGPLGTITVGLAKQNTNPFFSVFRSAMERGFYSAFRPYNDWTWCFSSAKAGYKLRDVAEDEGQGHDGVDSMGWETRHNGKPRAFRGSRDYCIDYKRMRDMRSNYVRMREPVYQWLNGKRIFDHWEYHWVYMPTENTWPVRDKLNAGWEFVYDIGGKYKRRKDVTYWRQSWNLTQSDWDAVLLPVRQGGSEAVEDKTHTHLAWMESVRDRKKLYSYEPVWKNRNDSFLDDLVGDAGWMDLYGRVTANGRFGDMFAGGEHDPDPNGDWSENFIENTSAGWNGWRGIPKTAADHPEDQSEKVQCRWNIGTPHGKLKWAEVTKFMFH